jgi:hypothetical protein
MLIVLELELGRTSIISDISPRPPADKWGTAALAGNGALNNNNCRRAVDVEADRCCLWLWRL